MIPRCQLCRHHERTDDLHACSKHEVSSPADKPFMDETFVRICFEYAGPCGRCRHHATASTDDTSTAICGVGWRELSPRDVTECNRFDPAAEREIDEIIVKWWQELVDLARAFGGHRVSPDVNTVSLRVTVRMEEHFGPIEGLRGSLDEVVGRQGGKRYGEAVRKEMARDLALAVEAALTGSTTVTCDGGFAAER